MSTGWGIYVALIVALNVVGSAWLLFWARTREAGEPEAGATTGHDFDGIEELDMPLPRWWLWMFVGTILFFGAYCVLYPGFGTWTGSLGWTSAGQHEAEVREAHAKYDPIYAAYASTPIAELARDPRAVTIGGRLFANTCAACHGADARGGTGFPNLSDDDWLYGGEPETIEATILSGRVAMMPAFALALGGDDGVKEVVAYVMSLSGQEADAKLAEAGKARFNTICIACHGMDAKGNRAMGAPNLTDDVWLFGGSAETIEEGLRKGRSSQMPAHKDILGEHKAHLVATYVYSLSHATDGGTPEAGGEAAKD
jgi:cytochrome c oxidase cbb3-type subunit III